MVHELGSRWKLFLKYLNVSCHEENHKNVIKGKWTPDRYLKQDLVMKLWCHKFLCWWSLTNQCIPWYYLVIPHEYYIKDTETFSCPYIQNLDAMVITSCQLDGLQSSLQWDNQSSSSYEISRNWILVIHFKTKCLHWDVPVPKKKPLSRLKNYIYPLEITVSL